jgi:fumarate reductase subunit C
MRTSEVNRTTEYTPYHPRWYRPRVSTYWWLGKWAYLKFVLRELSSIFVAYFVILTLAEINSLRRGPEAFAEFQQHLRNPMVLLLNGISLCFVVFHTITWFNLAPRAMVVRVGGKRLPDVLIAGANYFAWAAASAAVAWFVLRKI